jgi:hypothetical protein
MIIEVSGSEMDGSTTCGVGLGRGGSSTSEEIGLDDTGGRLEGLGRELVVGLLDVGLVGLLSVTVSSEGITAAGPLPLKILSRGGGLIDVEGVCDTGGGGGGGITSLGKLYCGFLGS